MSFMQKMIDETQMPITPEHAFKEKSPKLLILLSLRTVYNHTFQYETPCNCSLSLLCTKITAKLCPCLVNVPNHQSSFC